MYENTKCVRFPGSHSVFVILKDNNVFVQVVGFVNKHCKGSIP